ncbi:MAG: CDP-diacylglycerol-phosphatidylglycerol phosphatidyltransferase [Frankiales bacterium]|nr:CDP-diacylglycerol-phosphatidylglycerol phosphatidyltransferase [Frankiales bacterium]
MAEHAGADRIVTIPNALSLLRLLGVPVFQWLILGPHADGWALALLMVSGITDWLDGVLARVLNQRSHVGALLDPLADRLYIVSTIVALNIRGIIPVALTVAILLRDAVLTATIPVLRRRGYGPLQVHFLGKAATFAMLYALPLLLLGDGHNPFHDAARVAGWAMVLWGTGLYWHSAWLYVRQVRQLVGAQPPSGGLHHDGETQGATA